MKDSTPQKGFTMNRTDTLERLPKELDHRASDGLEVWLLWCEPDDRLLVVVVDSRAGDSFEITVGGSNALDAFRHPYAYAAWRGIDYAALRQAEPTYA
jgi:hypothetical protein